MRVLSALLVLVAVGSAGAQSLGDVARREAERRKAVVGPGKTYTNDQLKPEPSSSQPAAAPAATPPAAGDGAAKAGEGGPAKPAAEPAAPTPATDEKAWRAKVQAERDAVSRAQIFAEALQSRINGLSADFTARDDPSQRAAVAAERQKSLDELERVKKEIQQHTKALSEIQDEARKAGVPAGWLR